ncbi:orotate phosphoribosyltransferase [Actinorhabdospora filicis]|uniref:Orotate phosphoribosyltransferase n=1 Tax=Actinorhabdospora filicis TaxID=1785913 RepID=A0A9W6W8M6_9ACTN|nr:orotate phosphoribosyltransferase [Actinorhabdospora filicis]GLZ75830.1 orotate phosphoribosyltransferase [Actinorhabdospora filicis]
MANLASRIRARSHLTGTFTLRSGATSTEYFDKYLFESDPVLLDEIAQTLMPLVPSDVDALAGLELGGIPLAVALSLRTGLPMRFVRKEAKTYGTCRLAEGGRVDAVRLLIVEDVVSTGGAILDAVAELRASGATVKKALCVLDRETGGPEKLAEAGIQLTALYRMSELT